MAESDEEKTMLEDESMDEMHEIDEDLVESVNSDASPAKTQMASARGTRFRGSDDDDECSGSDGSELFNGDSSSDDEDLTPYQNRQARGSGPDLCNDSDEDEDPPEIPGSPLRTDARAYDENEVTTGIQQWRPAKYQSTAEVMKISYSNEGSDGSTEEYETKEREAPRAMEFHGSSSSSESDDAGDGDSGSDGIENNRRSSRKNWDSTHKTDRPKTPAKDLEPYKGLLPNEYYDQIVASEKSALGSAIITNSGCQAKTATGQFSLPECQSRKPSVDTSNSKYRARVPHEIEDLFHLVDGFKPEILDITTKLQPFIPEYVPAIGLPFDGIQIPRPDGKVDEAGIGYVREPTMQSNEAELKLLLSSKARKQRRHYFVGAEAVHSIDDAAHRPREIDQWIVAVSKVQASKPLPQVIYKRPMPKMAELMELWPEEMEVFLANQPKIALSSLDVNISELIRIVCGVVDIPVYEGLQIHSLHMLFSLYHEIVKYEKDMQATR